MKELILYALRRFCMLIPFLIGLTLVAFLLGVFVSGRPRAGAAYHGRHIGTDSGRTGCAAPCYGTGSAGMDPVWAWLMNALHGDLGLVLSYTENLYWMKILRRFPLLSIWRMGHRLGNGYRHTRRNLGCREKDTAGEIVLRAGALFFISVPSFFLAILCMLLFSEEWRLLPSGGYGSMIQMIMPSFVLAAGTSAAVMRLQQTSMTEVAGKEFITTERAKGLPMPFIMKRHVLPNALVPVITMLGTFFGAILGGSVIIEDMFSIPGLGSYVPAAIWGRDYPVIQGYVIVSGTVFLTFNYLVDILCGMLNPSVRKGGAL